MKSHALWHTSSVASVILEQELPDRNNNMLLIQSLYSLVSLGTERLVASALMPAAVWDQMAVPYMEGTFSLPCKYGYSLIGKVLKGPEEYRGKTVHLMHPHQDMLWVNVSSVSVIPDEIPAIRAVLASQVETAINALWDSGISPGDSVLVAGFGLVGAIIALLASGIPGVKVSVLEKNEYRKQVAREMCFDVPDRQEDNKNIYDLSIHTAGDEKALQFCIDHTGYEGQVTEVSFYGKKSISLILGETFHTGRKRIVVSQVSQIPSHKKNRWDLQRRKSLVFEMLKDKRFDLLVGNLTPFEQAPVLFNQIRYGLINDISVIFQYK
jgi:threonine dehydrogenase-like Zn-dependent dehydrogenase